MPSESVAFVGTASASSAHDDKHAAEMAFKPQQGSRNPWCSGTRPGAVPQVVWFQFENDFVLTKIGFSSRIHAEGEIFQAPKEFEVRLVNEAKLRGLDNAGID